MSIKQYRNKLDQALLKGPDALLAHMRKHGLPEPSNRASLVVTLHKTITGSTSLPMDVRSKSKAWLIKRGYTPLDDGEVP
jgi:hypothetical protein